MKEFTTILGGWPAGRPAGRVGEIDIKAISAQFQVKLATGAEFGNTLICCARHRARKRYSDESCHIYRYD